MAGPRTARAEVKKGWRPQRPAHAARPEEPGRGLVPLTRDQAMPNFSSLIAEKSLTSPPTRLVA